MCLYPIAYLDTVNEFVPVQFAVLVAVHQFEPLQQSLLALSEIHLMQHEAFDKRTDLLFSLEFTYLHKESGYSPSSTDYSHRTDVFPKRWPSPKNDSLSLLCRSYP